MKLHLGCGQTYLEGYVNIDFPPAEHTVQSTSVADLYTDIRFLRYPKNSVDEIRLHHVFEHFPRPVACGFLACWHTWLRPGGLLHLEVPDFARTATVILNPLSSRRKKAIAERHLYGSHEAPWANHSEGYTSTMLQEMLEVFGFKVKKNMKNSWMGTYNIVLIARKAEELSCFSEIRSRASNYLSLFLVDDSLSEQALHKVWLGMFDQHAMAGGAMDDGLVRGSLLQ